jgi:hypothetical protein
MNVFNLLFTLLDYFPALEADITSALIEFKGKDTTMEKIASIAETAQAVASAANKIATAAK